MQIQPPIINIFEKAVRKAGRSVVRDFGEIENLQIHSKGVSDFVTNSDLNTEKASQIVSEALMNTDDGELYLESSQSEKS